MCLQVLYYTVLTCTTLYYVLLVKKGISSNPQHVNDGGACIVNQSLATQEVTLSSDGLDYAAFPFPGYEDKGVYYCEQCSVLHMLDSTLATAPFTRKHGFQV